MHSFAQESAEECNIIVPGVASENTGAVKIESSCRLVKINVQIFNRWGNLMFEEKEDIESPYPKEYFMNWKFKDVSEGVYFYIIEYTVIGQNGNSWTGKKTGNITKI